VKLRNMTTPYSCESCGERFSRYTSLVAHKETCSIEAKQHNGGDQDTSATIISTFVVDTTPYSCEGCDHRFCLYKDLAEHRKTCRSAGELMKEGVEQQGGSKQGGSWESTAQDDDVRSMVYGHIHRDTAETNVGNEYEKGVEKMKTK